MKLPSSVHQLLSRLPSTGSSNANPVTVKGHIKAIRHLKKVTFIDLNDGSCNENLNVVLKNLISSTDTAVTESVKQLTDPKVLRTGQNIEINGTLTPKELQTTLSQIKIIGPISDDYPLQNKITTMRHLRTLPVLRFKTSKLSSLMRFRSFVDSEMASFLKQEGFFKTWPAVITGSDCEGAGELFDVIDHSSTISADPSSKQNASIKEKEKFFGKEAFLSVSAQLHLEALSSSLNRAYCINPCFRAETSDTNRHLSEFWMLEVEASHINEISQLTEVSENLIRHITKQLTSVNSPGNAEDLKKSRFDKAEVEEMERRWACILSPKPWARITYTEAVELLQKNAIKLSWGDSLSSDMEKFIANFYEGPVFITDYPKEQKPFYMKESFSTDKGRTVACFDLIVPEIGELIGGSIRIHDYEQLVNEINDRGFNAENMEWYLQLRKEGSVEHGGFGMGIERLLCYLGAISNVRDVIPFPREHGVCRC